MLDAASEVCGYTKGKPRYFERWCGAIKMWMWLCVERENYLGFGNKAGMRKIGKNIVRQKKVLRKQYIWLCIRKLKRRWRRLICVVMVVSCLELPKKRLGRRKMLVGLVVLKMKVGQ